MSLFLMYQADNPKQTLADLCALAGTAYVRRFARPARLFLVAPDAPDPLPARAERSAKVRPGVVWAGEANT